MRERARKCALPSIRRTDTEDAMNRQTWLWMQASVALVANAAAVIQRAASVVAGAPAPSAPRRDA